MFHIPTASAMKKVSLTVNTHNMTRFDLDNEYWHSQNNSNGKYIQLGRKWISETRPFSLWLSCNRISLKTRYVWYAIFSEETERKLWVKNKLDKECTEFYTNMLYILRCIMEALKTKLNKMDPMVADRSGSEASRVVKGCLPRVPSRVYTLAGAHQTTDPTRDGESVEKTLFSLFACQEWTWWRGLNFLPYLGGLNICGQKLHRDTKYL